MAVRAARARSRELLADFDLAKAGDRLVRTYSGGMRRRLDLAAALVARPPVLFLEVLGGEEHRRPAGDERLHRVPEAEPAANVESGRRLVGTRPTASPSGSRSIDRGLVIAEGTPDELKAQVGGGDRLEIHLCDGHRGEDAIVALAAIASDHPFVEDGSVSVPVA